MTLKIYEITSNIRALLDSLSDAPLNDEGVAPEDKAAIEASHQNALKAFQTEAVALKDQIRWMTAYALELQTQREARQAEMDLIVKNVLDKMDRQNQRDLKKEAWLQSTVFGAILSTGMPMPLKFPEFTVNTQKLPLTVVIENPAALPAEYLREIPAVEASTAPDKKKILADLKEGVVITGASLSKVAYKLTVK